MNYQDLLVALKTMCISVYHVLIFVVKFIALILTTMAIVAGAVLLLTHFPVISFSIIAFLFLGCWLYIELQNARSTREYEELVTKIQDIKKRNEE